MDSWCVRRRFSVFVESGGKGRFYRTGFLWVNPDLPLSLSSSLSLGLFRLVCLVSILVLIGRIVY